MKRPYLALLLFLCASLLRPATGAAQEVEVRDALLKTVTAWNHGAVEEFRSYFMPNVHGFYLDGAMLYEGLNPLEEDRALYAAGFKPNVAPRQVTVRVYGTAAAVAAYFSGTITLPGGRQLEGPWRYTETRIRDGATWKIVQWHFSRLDPQM